MEGLLRDRASALPVPGARTAQYREIVLSAPDGGRTDGAQRFTVSADLAVRIDGYDEQPVVYPRRLEVARAGDGWSIEREERAGGPPPLWDLGTVRTASGAHCRILALDAVPGLMAVMAAMTAFGDRAVASVSEVWGSAWPGRVLFELPATQAQFAQLMESDPASWTGMAAVTVAAPGAPGHAPADRVVVNPDTYGKLSDFGRQVVITHETTHVATRADTRAWTPLWLSEGVADWTAYRDCGRTPQQIAPELTRDVAAGRLPTALPADRAFAAGAEGISQAYEQSWLACALIARRHGPDKLVSFYRAVGAEDGQGEDRDHRTDRLLRAELGLGLAEFTRLWRDEVAALAAS